MKYSKSLITLIFTSMAFNAMADNQEENIDNKNNAKPLVIYSSQGSIELKNPSMCSQHRTETGSVAINCASQCRQSIDPKDKKILIQC